LLPGSCNSPLAAESALWTVIVTAPPWPDTPAGSALFPHHDTPRTSPSSHESPLRPGHAPHPPSPSPARTRAGAVSSLTRHLFSAVASAESTRLWSHPHRRLEPSPSR